MTFLIIEGKDLQNMVNLGAESSPLGYTAFLWRVAARSPEPLPLRRWADARPLAVAARSPEPLPLRRWAAIRHLPPGACSRRTPCGGHRSPVAV